MPRKTTVYLVEKSAFFALLLTKRIARALIAITRKGTKKPAHISFPNMLSALDTIVILLLADLTQTELRAIEIDLEKRHGITFDGGLTFEVIDGVPPLISRAELFRVSLPELVDRVAMFYLLIDMYFDLAELAAKDPDGVEAGRLSAPAFRALADALEVTVLREPEVRTRYLAWRSSDLARDAKALPII